MFSHKNEIFHADYIFYRELVSLVAAAKLASR